MLLPCHARAFHSCLNDKELLARNRRNISSLSDSDGIQTNNHLVCKQTFNHLAKLANLAKWLSVRLSYKWLWVRIPLLPFNKGIFGFANVLFTYGNVWFSNLMQLGQKLAADSIKHLYMYKTFMYSVLLSNFLSELHFVVLIVMFFHFGCLDR